MPKNIFLVTGSLLVIVGFVCLAFAFEFRSDERVDPSLIQLTALFGIAAMLSGCIGFWINCMLRKQSQEKRVDQPPDMSNVITLKPRK